MTALADLQKMVIAQKTATLPAAPASPVFAALHTALEAYDGLLSGQVIQVITGQAEDVQLDELSTIQAQVESQFSAPDLPPGRDLENYRKYKNRLDQMAALLAAVKADENHA